MSILFWVLLAIGLAVVEIVSVTFFPIFFTISAVIAAVLQLSGVDDPLVQWIVFGVGGLALSAALRPLAKRQLEKGPTLQSNVELLVGRLATVTATIDGRAGTGAVTVDGEIWSAKPATGSLGVIAQGTDVEIHEVRGATLLVAPRATTGETTT